MTPTLSRQFFETFPPEDAPGNLRREGLVELTGEGRGHAGRPPSLRTRSTSAR